MKLYRTTAGIAVEAGEDLFLLPEKNWDTCINRDNLHRLLQVEIRDLPP